MFTPRNTAFILGAGASWHYGYPTGEKLVKKVTDKARFLSDHIGTVLQNTSALADRPKYVTRNSTVPYSGGLNGMKNERKQARQECDDLIDRLTTVDPIVIDYFLGQNPHLADIGKLMIAWVLLECEAIYRKHQINNNRREALKGNENYNTLDHLRTTYADNWYRFLVHKLVTGCVEGNDLLRNNVSFVTFNYDVSLEYELYRSLRAISQFSEGNVIDKFFEGDRFIHVYGQIRQNGTEYLPDRTLDIFAKLGPRTLSASPTAFNESAQEFNNLLDVSYEASRTIRTIAPHEKTTSKEITKARKAIRDANCIYVLGYGFDENNSKLLDLSDSLNIGKNQGKTILFTNFNDYNQVNKKAARIITGSPTAVLTGEKEILKSNIGSICEKSRRTVYDALAFDFDSPEEG
jgi:hypothetical protein